MQKFVIYIINISIDNQISEVCLHTAKVGELRFIFQNIHFIITQI